MRDDPTGRVACETLVTTGLAFIAGEISTKTYVDLPVDRAPDDQGDRLHARQVRLRLRDLRGHVLDRPAVARHRPGRGHGRRRRPGHDVRLRGPRDRGADAAPADAGAPAGAAALGGAPQGRARLPAARRQVAGHRGVRGPPRDPRRDRRRLHPARRGHQASRPEGSHHRRGHPSGDSGGPADATRPSSTSTRPAASSSGARRGTAASPAARSSSTPTAAALRTAAARSPARIRRRSTARRPTWRATSPRTWSPPASRSGRSSSSPMRSASPSRSPCTSTPTARARLPEDRIVALMREHFELTPKGIIESLNLRRPIYRATAAFGHFGRRLPGVHLGADGSGGGAGPGRGSRSRRAGGRIGP